MRIEAVPPAPALGALAWPTAEQQALHTRQVVLLKGCDERGLVWYTNYDSRKGQQLAGNPFAALQFHWVELERVVRIEGRVSKVSDADSDAYFASRPLDSRIGAWAMKPSAAKTPMPASSSKPEFEKATTEPEPVRSVLRPT